MNLFSYPDSSIGVAQSKNFMDCVMRMRQYSADILVGYARKLTFCLLVYLTGQLLWAHSSGQQLGIKSSLHEDLSTIEFNTGFHIFKDRK